MINLIENKFNNIEWVTFLDSGVSWPILWVSVCTHWWEVVWLDILNYLFNEIDIKNNLLKWQIYFIVNNIKAANKMLDLINNGKQITQQDLIETRFIDENMNRCCSVENLKKSSWYEPKRANELTPILKNLDILFDIHSTNSPTESMIIFSNKSFELFKNTFNCQTEIVWINDVVNWKPFMDIVERNWWVWIAIESWYQLDKTWYKIWLDNLLRFLIDLKMLSDETENVSGNLQSKESKKTIKIFDSIIVRWKDFKFNKKYEHLDVVKTWELVCFDWEKDIFAKKDFLVIMPVSKTSDLSKMIWEEVCFMWEYIC